MCKGQILKVGRTRKVGATEHRALNLGCEKVGEAQLNSTNLKSRRTRKNHKSCNNDKRWKFVGEINLIVVEH